MNTAHTTTAPKEIRQVIANSHLFRGLQPDFIEKIATSVTRKTAGVNEILFQKGDPADALWGVLSGRVVIEVGTDDGKEMILDTFGEGDVFGEVGVLDFGPRRVEARAVQKSELFRLERTYFLKHLQSSPELCFRVFSLLCSHLRETTTNLEDTVLSKLPNRLAKRLILLADDSGAGGDTVLHIIQSDLADMLGVRRQAVNRHLREFEKGGLIALKRQIIEIMDYKALAKLASLGQNRNHAAWGSENPGLPDHKAFAFSQALEDNSAPLERHLAGLIAIDAAEYSRFLMADVAGTLKRIEAGFTAIEQAIGQYEGHTVWHTGDRVLAEFPDAKTALQVALSIHEQVSPARHASEGKKESLFRIGVHYGEVLADDHRFLGEAVNTAIRLTELSGAGGIALSGAVHDQLENLEQLELQFLGDHELKNVSRTIPVYSASAIPRLKMLALRAETLLPRRFRPAALTVAVLVLIAGIWFGGDRVGHQSVPVTVSPLSIAVLPFSNEGDPELDYLANGIPQEVRASLSTIPGMLVIGRESSDYYKTHTASPEEIGRTLAVAWVLQGSVESRGGEIQSNIQLFNTASDEVVWEEEFHDYQGNFAGFGSDIVQRVVASFGISESDALNLPQFRPLTTSADAHALYMEAQSYYWLAMPLEVIKAIPLLQAAIELDPSFAEAHAFLSRLYLATPQLDEQERYTPALLKQLAQQSLKTAISLAPDSPQVLATASVTRRYSNDYEGALALAERALKIDPNNIEALWARYSIYVREPDLPNAARAAERLAMLEPLSVQAMSVYWDMLMRANRYHEALEVAERTLSFYPENIISGVNAMISDSMLMLGDRLGAIKSFRKGPPYGYPIDMWTGLDVDPMTLQGVSPGWFLRVHVYRGDYQQAREMLKDMYPNPEAHTEWLNSAGYLVSRGELETLAGNIDAAVDYFESARALLSAGAGSVMPRQPGKPEFTSALQSDSRLMQLFAYRQSGHQESADEIAAQFETQLDTHLASLATISDQAEYDLLYGEAQYLAIEGRVSEAIKKLRAWSDHGIVFTYVSRDPFLDSLRGNPGFEAIVAKVESELAEVRAEYHAQQAALAGAPAEDTSDSRNSLLWQLNATTDSKY